MKNKSRDLPKLSELLPSSRILLNEDVLDWREAIRVAGRLLVDTSVVEPRYVEAMIQTAEDLGPYIVLAPRIAMPHARPEDGALATGLSLVKLAAPVDFGNEDHGPVTLVFGLAAKDKQLHVAALQTLAELLSTRALLEELLASDTIEDVYAVIEQAEEQVDA